MAASPSDCRSIMLDFIAKADKKENVSLLKNNWKASEKKKFLDEAKSLGFSDSDIKLLIEGLNMQTQEVSLARVKNYLTYVLSLSDKEQKVAILDIAQLDAREINSKHIKKFIQHEKKIQEKSLAKKFSPEQERRYQELYYGCRALRPNDVNKNAARDFKRFNLALNLGTLGASYAFYNMDKDINGEWFAKLGYDVGITLLFSYVGGSIQTKATDTQIVKSLKSYLMGRVMGLTDVAIYDPMFNKEREKAEARIEELKKNPENKAEIEKLLKSYNERGLYRKYKAEVISALKSLPEGISLGVKGNSVDENNVDWNNLSHADLDRPEVQEVLVLAAMAQVYEESKGQWIDTGDAGLDRYAFNTVFYAVQIPKSIAQNFITYKMLCMGQDNAKLSFTKAVIFNVSTNFIVNQGLYGYREKAINQ
ncbi:hypothetical protein DOM21_05045 [Bacteriovorax stolpii]|uniref:Uncharacterized protein n=2 Tax=Bacteriovorax stolpii TaxID=960 RepID=A0A2K9NUH6_BACTC|nr:hypothetical protein C0V70_13955 [Bacteriovorax stolpii]QDK40832.1 hypothetical protein DOM21_05045 [Bacteriovorax stolpii]